MKLKTLDIIAAVLLVIGGLVFGIMGFFNRNFIEMLFGNMHIVARIIYCLIGLSALYQIFQWNSTKRKRR